jgi:hypothetical protein
LYLPADSDSASIERYHNHLKSWQQRISLLRQQRDVYVS